MYPCSICYSFSHRTETDRRRQFHSGGRAAIWSHTYQETRGCWYLSPQLPLFTHHPHLLDPAKTVFHWQACPPLLSTPRWLLCSTGAGGRGQAPRVGRGMEVQTLCQVTAHSPQPVSPRPLCWFPCRTLLQDRLRVKLFTCAKNPVSTGSEHQEKAPPLCQGRHPWDYRFTSAPPRSETLHIVLSLLNSVSSAVKCSATPALKCWMGKSSSAHFVSKLSGPEQEEVHIYLPHLLSQQLSMSLYLYPRTIVSNQCFLHLLLPPFNIFL